MLKCSLAMILELELEAELDEALVEGTGPGEARRGGAVAGHVHGGGVIQAGP